MNCLNHPEANAVAFCRECGKPMCVECRRPAAGSLFCAEHLPAAAVPPPIPERHFPESRNFGASPYSAPVYGAPVADPTVHPVLALILGFAPGVGAIYNGQYAKGLIHAVVFGLLISLANNLHNSGMQGFIGIMIAIWVIYQAFEAYHTARKRRYGLVVEEYSSLFEFQPTSSRFPMGAVFLIGLGFVLLLDTMDILRQEDLARYWPLVLIVVGIYMLYVRLNPAETVRPPAGDVHSAEGDPR